MDCALATLHTLIACFSWSGLYIDGGVQFNDYEMPRAEWTTPVTLTGPNVVETISYQSVVTERENPYGRLALGYEVALKSVSVRLEASHVSSFATDDGRGLNALTFSVRWYPFR